MLNAGLFVPSELQLGWPVPFNDCMHITLKTLACAALVWACADEARVPTQARAIVADREDVALASVNVEPEPVVVEPTPVATVEPEPEPVVVEPTPIRFGFRVAGHAAVVQSALDRWVAATCIDIAIDEAGAHEVLFTTEGFTSPTRIGQTTGRWEAATIRIRDEGWLDEQLVTVLMHELAHLFAVTNDHLDESVLAADDGFAPRNQFISEQLLAMVCEHQVCRCFNPE